MRAYLKRLSPSGKDGLTQSLTVPREVSRLLDYPETVKMIFDGTSLIITPIRIEL